MKKVLILGGYGNFGAHITRRLAAEHDMRVVIAGRSQEKCQQLAAELQKSPNLPLYHALDAHRELPAVLERVQPAIVIHASGPFQSQGYHVAEACIAHGCHYIDLADGREFVTNIRRLDAPAREKGVTVISGASSVPCLTAAVADYYLPQFQRLTALEYAITTAQKAGIGEATAAAMLSYAGKPFTTLQDGRMEEIYGWLGMHLHNYPELGFRLHGNCDIPDLSLFPERYKSLETIRFHAGQEIKILHIGLWAMAWMVRMGLIGNLAAWAKPLLKIARGFGVFGSDKSGFYMKLSGTGADGVPRKILFYLVAGSGHGPVIPATPAVLCAKMLARGGFTMRGAFPCMGIVTLPQYLEALRGLDIQSMEQRTPA